MRTLTYNAGREILRPEIEGGHTSIIEHPACVGGKNDILCSSRISTGDVLVLRRKTVSYIHDVRYYFEHYTFAEVR